MLHRKACQRGKKKKKKISGDPFATTLPENKPARLFRDNHAMKIAQKEEKLRDSAEDQEGRGGDQFQVFG